MLPAKKPDQTFDEAEDEAIELLISSALDDLKFNGHEVKNVSVKCTNSMVNINGNVHDNEHILQEETEVVQKVMEDAKMSMRKLRETNVEIAKKLLIILKHVDNRIHGYCFRKCSPLETSSCNYCKKFPPRSSKEFWQALPKKDSGGLFFDCEPDLSHPGHYRTLLDLVSNVDKLKIKPDGMFPEVLRCQVINHTHSIQLISLVIVLRRRSA